MYRKLFTSHLPVGDRFLCVCLLDASVHPDGVSVFQLLSHVRLFAALWTAACQAPLSSSVFRLLKFMSIESVMLSNHLSLLLPSPFPISLSQHQGLFQWVGSSHQVTRVLRAWASASVLWRSIQGWFPIGLTVLNPCSSQDSQGSFPAPQFESISSLAFSLLYSLALTSLHDYWKNHSFDYIELGWQSDVCFLIHCLGLL